MLSINFTLAARHAEKYNGLVASMGLTPSKYSIHLVGTCYRMAINIRSAGGDLEKFNGAGPKFKNQHPTVSSSNIRTIGVGAKFA